ncbi:MAG: PAS domain S-box protein [Deltaproteobacteria bacterium]|nr:PAS domain S-box protein [Deltaproteobacteria bacterium]
MISDSCPPEKELLEAILQVSPVGIGIVRKRILLWGNTAMQRMLGYDYKELHGKSAAVLYPSKEEFDRVGRELYGMLERDGFGEVSARCVRKDGFILNCRVHARPTNSRDPQDGYVVAAVVADTGRLETEAALYIEKEKFRILVEESSLGIAIIDRQGRYTYINPEFTHMFGYTLADIPTGKEWFEKAYPDPEYRRKAISTWIDDLKRATNIRDRYRTFQVTCKSGKEKTVHFRPVTMSTGKHLVIYLDLTEQENMKSRLFEAQKMEAMAALSGGVAHDFNNILGAILGYTELAQLKLPQEPGVVEYCLENILKAGHRAKELVKQILYFSRRSEQVTKPVRIGPIMKEVSELLRAVLSTTIGIRLQLATPDDLVLADPDKIHQMLMNLCTNAYHAMAESGGVLDLSLNMKQIDSRAVADFPELHPGEHIVLTVKDTGHGMSPELLNRIFEPYFTTKCKDLGTGLGLSVVQTIVQSHGGAIRVKSEPGEGSQFSIFLPAFHGKDSSAVLHPDQLPGGHERILFVDDEEMLADLGKRVLEHLGYSVCVQTSSMEALEIFRADPLAFSLVITDLAMPDLPGDQLARKVLKIRPDIPVILCTGYSERISEEKAEMIGIRDVIMKPLVIHKIAKTLRRHLED